MKVKLLVLEDADKKIQDFVTTKMREEGEEDTFLTQSERDYQRMVRELNGTTSEGGETKSFIVDLTPLHEEVDFFFKADSVQGLFMSSKLYKNKPIMVLVLNAEYDCVYDEKIFNTLTEKFLNN